MGGASSLGSLGLGAYGLAQAGTALSSLGKGASSVGALGGLAGFCYIFIEATDGKVEPSVMEYFLENMSTELKRGYHWLAERLCPAMMESKSFKDLVNRTIIEPVTKYVRFKYGKSEEGEECKVTAECFLELLRRLGNRPQIISAFTGEVI